MRTDADARGPTNPTTRVRWANASTARKTRQRLSPSGRIAKCPALRPPSARRVGMGLTCCWWRKISGRRISNWELEISDDQGERSKKQEENDPKTPTFRRHRESEAPEKSKASSEFNVGHPPDLSTSIQGKPSRPICKPSFRSTFPGTITRTTFSQ